MFECPPYPYYCSIYKSRNCHFLYTFYGIFHKAGNVQDLIIWHRILGYFKERKTQLAPLFQYSVAILNFSPKMFSFHARFKKTVYKNMKLKFNK